MIIPLLIVILSLTACQSSPSLLAGSVRDAEGGAAIAGAWVQAGALRVATDGQGRYSLPLDEGRYVVTISATGYVPHTGEVTVYPGESAHHDVSLDGRRLRGRVTDESGERPMQGATVRCGAETATTDAAGLFEVRAVALADLSITCAGCLPINLTSADVDALYDGSGMLTEPAAFALAPRVLSGVVREPDGTPIQGATVSAGGRETLTGPDGRYELRYVEKGVEVTAHSPAHRDEARAAYDGETELELALEPWQVVIRVLEADTELPLSGARIMLPGQGEALATTADDGRATVRVIPGTALEIEHTDYYPVDLTHDGETELRAEMRAVRLTGRLTHSETGEAVAGALVQAFAPGSETPIMLRSDEEGHFSLERGVEVERVLVKAPGYARVEQPLERSGRVEIALEPFEARAIYIPFGLLTLPDRIDELLDMVARTELTAVVIDVKGDRARLAWPSKVPLAQEIGAYAPYVMDIEEVLRRCHERGIYTIARMVVFKDDVLAEARPGWTVRRGGAAYKDLEGLRWVDPFLEEVWDYNIALAREVAALGFDEIQLDYLRFPSDGQVTGLTYSQASTLESRTQTIAEFCRRFYEAISATPAFTSADIFGLTMWVTPESDMGIGQRVHDIAQHMDYISPMLYPQTFGPGNLGYARPLLHPYEVIFRSVRATQGRTDTLVRPWLQHYSLGGVTYGPVELLKQRKGSEDAGGSGWIYWNSRGQYDERIFEPDAYRLLPEGSIPTVE
jgi:hypothetical protein